MVAPSGAVFNCAKRNMAHSVAAYVSTDPNLVIAGEFEPQSTQ
jgi:hypothetical protein